MGKLRYRTPESSFEFDDRVLAHLRVVIISKLRRGDRFIFTWANTPESGGGHTSSRLDPTIPMQFKFYGSRDPHLSRNWLDALARLTNALAGLHVLPEPPEHTLGGAEKSENLAKNAHSKSPAS